ncbi:MAG: hypothetical protein ACOX5A_11865 [Aminivibrio sp.]|jgi:hypothetical protein
MSIIVDEAKAREMVCPFVGGPCAGMACMGWQSKGACRGTCLRMLAVIMGFKRRQGVEAEQ